MEIKKRIVLIPYWIEETLRRNQLPLATCLDFAKLRPLLALSDLIGFSTLQRYTELVTGAKEVYPALSDIWYDSLSKDQADEREFLLHGVTALDDGQVFRKDIFARLFEAEAKLQQYQEPCITYDLTPGVCGVVIYPGFFGAAATPELQRSLIEAILKVLYVYCTYSEVAQTSLFKRYLELLSADLASSQALLAV